MVSVSTSKLTMILYISDVQCGRRVVLLKYPLEQQRVLFRICTISQKMIK